MKSLFVFGEGRRRMVYQFCGPKASSSDVRENAKKILAGNPGIAYVYWLKERGGQSQYCEILNASGWKAKMSSESLVFLIDPYGKKREFGLSQISSPVDSSIESFFSAVRSGGWEFFEQVDPYLEIIKEMYKVEDGAKRHSMMREVIIRIRTINDVGGPNSRKMASILLGALDKFIAWGH